MNYIATSIFDIFKVGPGPSSSHTIGPMRAANLFLGAAAKLPSAVLARANGLDVCLYGSLSSTGKGHGSDRAIIAGLMGWQPETCDTVRLLRLLQDPLETYGIRLGGKNILLSRQTVRFGKLHHSFPYQNVMVFRLMAGRRRLLEKVYYSIGGGFVLCEGEREKRPVRPLCAYSNMAGMRKMLSAKNLSLPDLMFANERALTGNSRTQTLKRLMRLLSCMDSSVKNGLCNEGLLPGPIGLSRKAPGLYRNARKLRRPGEKFLALLNAYAMAASEENAAGQRIVTAPTSGSAGVLPGVIYLLRHEFKVPLRKLCEGLLAAAAIGGIIKHNASISGAEVGCQGEIGAAAAMAAALLACVNGQDLSVVENAAEIALEHHLGMTCDPVDGYVQIPCIERNAVGAVTAYTAYLLASAGDPHKQKLKFDEVVEAMLETGRDMSKKYKETSRGGLAVCAACC
ncbi:MAG: L-serine ammonia-lyase [Lentisphaerae bacterium GWF2_52_8]|nr:MAG: L-serine ammonia-lyase [Lentisphaerae bacterium GWF2_52_8]